MDEANPLNETEYESHLTYNPLISYIHSLRYKHIIDIFEELESDLHGSDIRVLEMGCASGKLFGILDKRFSIRYTGVDKRKDRVDVANKRYLNNSNFFVIHDSVTNKEVFQQIERPDIVVALEILEHIPEHDVVRLVENIAEISPKLFVCSVPVEVGPIVWIKNIGSVLMRYDRHKKYSWNQTFWAGLYQLDKLPPHGTGHKGFDWRWLAQTIRHNMKIREIRKFPIQFLPASLSNSVFIVGVPRKSP